MATVSYTGTLTSPSATTGAVHVSRPLVGQSETTSRTSAGYRLTVGLTGASVSPSRLSGVLLHQREGLLPPNATALENALDRSFAWLNHIPVPIDRLWSPQRAPDPTLPWLAWSFSADIWRSDWREAKQRAVIERSYELHRKKGTLAGIEDIINIGGGKLQRVVVPPAQTYLAPSWTQAERKQFLERFPELRVFRFATRGTRHGAMPARDPVTPGRKTYPSNSDGSDGAVIGSIPVESTAAQRRDGIAKLVQPDGTEKPLTTIRYATDTETLTFQRQVRQLERPQKGGEVAYEIREAAPRGRTAMLTDPASGAPVAQLFLGGNRNHVSNKRPYDRWFITTLKQTSEIPTREPVKETVRPAAETIRAFSERNFFSEVTGERLRGEPLTAQASTGTEQGVQQGAVFGRTWLGLTPGNSHPVMSDAARRIFERTRLFRKGVMLESRGKTFHLGVMRLGMPPYNAELTVALRDKRPFRAVNRFVSGHFVAKDFQARYGALLRAMDWSVAARDKVLVNTITHRPIKAGGDVLVGPHTAGQFVETT